MTVAESPGETPPVEEARGELQAAVPEAAATLRALLDADDERIQIRAAETILDRAGVTKAKRITSHQAETDVGGRSSSAGLPDDLL